MNCTHDTAFLMGTADGIICRNCNRKFKTFAEIEQEKQAEQPKEPAESKPKRKRKEVNTDA